MTVVPTDLAPRADGNALREPEALGAQWAALQEAAGAVAELAGLSVVVPDPPVRDFPHRMGKLGGWRQELAINGVADMAAMMTPGVKALLAVSARGQDPTPAALALWREYHAACAALLALVPEACAEEVSDAPSP